MHRSVLRQAFDGGDLLALDRAHRQRARTHRNAVDVNRARAALGDAAAVFRAGETDMLADHPQEWRVTLHLHVVRRPIDVELGHELPPFAHSIASAAEFAYVSSIDRNLPYSKSGDARNAVHVLRFHDQQTFNILSAANSNQARSSARRK